jgi:hypothetical protein
LSALPPFILEFVKALLRTNYYSADHLEARRSVSGLFERWRAAVPDGELRFVALNRQDEPPTIVLSGPELDEAPLSKVVGRTTAELFAPKLLEFMNRADIVAFTLGRFLEETEFLAFLELMARPHDAHAESVNRLDAELLARNIRHVTVLFRKDIVGGERKLSWPAALALSRLGKDLSRLPIYKDVSAADVLEIRAQILSDVLRPAGNPILFSEILLNLDIVDMGSERPLTVSEILPRVSPALRFSTAVRIEQEHARLRAADQPAEHLGDLLGALCAALTDDDPAPAVVDLAQRVIAQGTLDASMLPEPLARAIQIRRLADDWLRDLDRRLANLRDPQLLEEAGKVLPELLRRELYSEAATIAAALGEGATALLSEAMTAQTLAGLAKVYRSTPPHNPERRGSILALLGSAGESGASELASLLEVESRRNAQVLRASVAALGQREITVVFLAALGGEDVDEAVAEALLPCASKGGAGCLAAVLEFTAHRSSAVRRHAIEALAPFGKSLAEERLVALLRDPQPEVRATTIEALGRIGSRRIDVLDTYQTTALDASAPPAVRAACVKALSRIPSAPLPGGKRAEGVLIDCLRHLPNGLKAKLRSLGEAELNLYVSVCSSLGAIGTSACLGALETVSKHRMSELRESARAALTEVKARG